MPENSDVTHHSARMICFFVCLFFRRQNGSFSVHQMYFYLQRFVLCSREIYQFSCFCASKRTPIMGLANITGFKKKKMIIREREREREREV